MKRIVTIALLAASLGCAGSTTRRGGLPWEELDSSDPRWEKSCKAAEVNLVRLRCPEASLPSGEAFASFCVRKMADGIPLAPRCLSAVTACEEVESVCNP